MSESHDDLWFVQLTDGAVRAYTLDELDAAFQAGTIDESTPVRHDASSEWAPLADVLAGSDGLEEAAAPAAPAATVEAAPPSVPPISAAPPPVVAELADLDVDAPQFGASKKRSVAAVVGLVAVLGAVGVTAMRLAASTAASNDTAKLTASLAAPAAQESNGGSDLGGDAGAGPRLSDEQRRLLLDHDKKLEAEAAAKRANRPSRGPSGSSRPIKIGDPIQKGGSKYDPLNGAL